jgi:outer membrane protein
LVRERYVTMQKRLELMELEEQNVVAATQNLQLQQDKYNIGATTSLEFRDAQVNLIRSQSTLIVARFQARISRLEIEQLIGNIQVD